jgi:hypothetical protein
MDVAQQRRRGTNEDVSKMLNMAQKYPIVQIASEIGRPIASVRTKTHELALSLGMDRSQRRASEPPSLGLRTDFGSGHRSGAFSRSPG